MKRQDGKTIAGTKVFQRISDLRDDELEGTFVSQKRRSKHGFYRYGTAASVDFGLPNLQAFPASLETVPKWKSMSLQARTLLYGHRLASLEMQSIEVAAYGIVQPLALLDKRSILQLGQTEEPLDQAIQALEALGFSTRHALPQEINELAHDIMGDVPCTLMAMSPRAVAEHLGAYKLQIEHWCEQRKKAGQSTSILELILRAPWAASLVFDPLTNTFRFTIDKGTSPAIP